MTLATAVSKYNNTKAHGILGKMDHHHIQTDALLTLAANNA
jgi:hypothetical protein